MSGRFTAACVQMTSGPEPGPNLAAATALIRRARAEGAGLVMTPEVTDMLEPRRRLTLEKAEPEDRHRGLAALRELAAALGIWLLPGSLIVRLEGGEGESGRLANRSFLIDPAGAIAARYDKIHLFDVEIPDGRSYRESAAYDGGGRAVTAELPWGRLGLTVCYDLRFPQLYRALAQAGCHFLTAPSAFTRFTGEAHWHLLLRARAIETGCYLFAPAQCGDHPGGRESYGHSLIVAPWGEVLADGGEAPGVVAAEIDPARVAAARAMIPSLRHDRAFTLAAPARALRAAGE